MSYSIKAFDKFLPKFNTESLVAQRRARILVFAHFYFLVISIILFLSLYFWESIMIWGGIVAPFLLSISLFYFKKGGNIRLSGNILAIISNLVLIQAIIHTGGLNSSLLLWLFSIPLTTCLVDEILSSSIWLLFTFCVFTALFILGQANPALNIRPTSDFYQLLSYILGGGYNFFILIIFGSAQVFAIKTLKEKNAELNNQKQTISQQLENLELIELKLKETNAELQNFAFSASHDLKEPLRMIGMYTQLIQRRLKNLSDDKSITEYMFFVTDGVKRMQNLLDNLLLYSRLGKNTQDTKEVDLNDIFNVVQKNLTVSVKESNTVIECKSLPTLVASVTEMTQLFQNLISNSIKFRKPTEAPHIKINYIDNNHEHLFTFSDNGIGIKQEHLVKVFDIFTRLHSQAEYEGTGIGLATCKKIITNLGGRIWLTSTEGEGTIFYFTIPKGDIIKMDSQLSYRADIEKAA